MNKLLSYIINTYSEGYMNIVATHIMITIAVSYSVFTIKPPFLKGLTEPRASNPPLHETACLISDSYAKSSAKVVKVTISIMRCIGKMSIACMPTPSQKMYKTPYSHTILPQYPFCYHTCYWWVFFNLNTSHILFHVTLYQTFNNHKPNRFIDM